MSKKPRNIAAAVASANATMPQPDPAAGRPMTPEELERANAQTNAVTDDELRKDAGEQVVIDPDRLDVALFEATDDLEELLLDITEEVTIDGKPTLRLKAHTNSEDNDDDLLDSAINALGFVRREMKNVEAEAKKRVDATIPIDVAAKLKTLATDKSDLTSRLGVIEKRVVTVLSAALEAGELQKSNKSEAGVTLTVVYKDKIEIVDAATIPDEFLLPRAQCIDMKKLGEALAAHANKVEAAATLELPAPPSPAPGATIGQSFSFTTKVPEVVG